MRKRVCVPDDAKTFLCLSVTKMDKEVPMTALTIFKAPKSPMQKTGIGFGRFANEFPADRSIFRKEATIWSKTQNKT